LLLAERPQLAAARLAPPLERLGDRSLQRYEHVFVFYPSPRLPDAPTLCPNPPRPTRGETATEGRSPVSPRACLEARSFVYRDVELVEALPSAPAAFERYPDEAARTPAAARPGRGRRRQVLAAALRHAVDFRTWQSLA